MTVTPDSLCSVPRDAPTPPWDGALVAAGRGPAQESALHGGRSVLGVPGRRRLTRPATAFQGRSERMPSTGHVDVHSLRLTFSVGFLFFIWFCLLTVNVFRWLQSHMYKREHLRRPGPV